LAAIKEFTGRASRSQLDRWFDAIQRGMTTDDLPVVRPQTDTLPPPRVWAEKNPDADGRFKRARTDVTATATELDIPLENLLTPEYLRRIAWSPPDPISAETVADALRELGARPWQVDAIAQVIAEAFVRIDQTPEDPDETAS
ncbi:MAG: ribonuclease D, partial [Pseudolysinimonas sp.]